MAKISKKQGEEMVAALVLMGTIKEDEADSKLQELITNGIVSSGMRLGEGRTEFANPEQKAIYDAGRGLLKATREFWTTNEFYKFLQSNKVEVGIADDDGNITGTTKIAVEPSVALKNNKVVMASFDVGEDAKSASD